MPVERRSSAPADVQDASLPQEVASEEIVHSGQLEGARDTECTGVGARIQSYTQIAAFPELRARQSPRHTLSDDSMCDSVQFRTDANTESGGGHLLQRVSL